MAKSILSDPSVESQGICVAFFQNFWNQEEKKINTTEFQKRTDELFNLPAKNFLDLFRSKGMYSETNAVISGNHTRAAVIEIMNASKSNPDLLKGINETLIYMKEVCRINLLLIYLFLFR